MTESEKFVADLCSKSFLPFWSFQSPVGKKGNELCDLLVVCGNIIIIISVKDITPSKHQDEIIVYNRWINKAVLESVSQIYGAEKYLAKVDAVKLKNSEITISLPIKQERIIYRIAIAFGSKAYFPLTSKDFQDGFINVFDQESTMSILKELDTIIDFANYLTEKQKFIENNVIVSPSEMNLLALYLQTGLRFEIQENVILAGDNLWEDYIKSDAYLKWKTDIEVSYFWDIMIQSFFLNNPDLHATTNTRNDLERAIRIIALEPRSVRKNLGLIMENTVKTKVKARILKPYDDAEYAYVFMPLTEINWEHKEAELGLRCIVARAELPEVKKVIGIAAGRTSDGLTFDFHYIDAPEIDDEFIERANLIKDELGFFKSIKKIKREEM